MKRYDELYIAIDFDGTCVEHRFPDVGRSVPGAVSTLKMLVDQGHKLFLWTCRDGVTLEPAVQWFADNGIELSGINCNPLIPEGTFSAKMFCNVYIDDAALGTPLICQAGIRPYVDWYKMQALLRNYGALPPMEVM